MIKQIKYNRLRFKLENLLTEKCVSEISNLNWRITDWFIKEGLIVLWSRDNKENVFIIYLNSIRIHGMFDEFDDDLLIHIINNRYNEKHYKMKVIR